MKIRSLFFLFCVFLNSPSPSFAGERFDIQAPPGSGSFGEKVATLPNGNIVVVDALADAPFTDSGAVYLYSGKTFELISRLRGVIYFDRIGGGFGGGINVLPSGDFIVRSPYWQNGRGAVTWCSQTTGCEGEVTEQNSLVGRNAGFNEPVFLTNGNFVIRSANAATFCSGTSPTVGDINAANSLVGTRNDDGIARRYVTPLSNGGYAVESPEWNESRGAVTFCGPSGCTGLVTPANSLVGSSIMDRVGSSSETIATPGFPYKRAVSEVGEGNYIVESSYWKNTGEPYSGAITWVHSAAGITGPVSPSNSLVAAANVKILNNGNFVVITNGSAGTRQGAVFVDGNAGIVGTATPTNSLGGAGGVHALVNGNYLVLSPGWQGDAIPGAVTFCNGTAGCSGEISESRSLVGTYSLGDQAAVVELANGNYVVNSYRAATFASGNIGIAGRVSIDNSLITAGWGLDIVALANGNYYVLDDGGNGIRASATFGNGQTGTIGTISPSNSLMNDMPGGGAGQLFTFPLPGGDIVVLDAQWNNLGSATRLSGTEPTSAIVSASNSLIGSTPNRGIGWVNVLPNGNYVVYHGSWNGGRGAVRTCKLDLPCVGSINESNSLVGTNDTDYVGNGNNTRGVISVGSHHYVANTTNWGGDRGAVTLIDSRSPVTGPVSPGNSLVGSTPGDGLGSGDYNATPFRLGTQSFGDGVFVIFSPGFDSNGLVNVGATTVGSIYEPLVGSVNNQNSLIGTKAHGGTLMSFVYDRTNRRVVVGHGGSNMVSIFRPTVEAPPIRISGTVRTPGGSPLRNLVVTLTDDQGVVRRATTSSFGIFAFDDVSSAPRDYTITVSSKRYRFAPRIIPDATADLDVGSIVGIE